MKKAGKNFITFAIAAMMLVWMPLVMSQSAYALSICSPAIDLFSSLTPNITNFSDSNAINAGVKFNVGGSPTITGVKFYKGIDNTGTHVAHLYDATTSTDLASATFSSETGSGWQSVNFSSAIPVTSTHNYVVWVSMPNGHYAVDSTGTGGNNNLESVSNGGHGPFTHPALEVSAGTNSGVYSYTSDHTATPSNGTNNNYWVSPVLFDETAPQNNSGVDATDAAAGPAITWSSAGHDTNGTYSDGSLRATYIERTHGMTNDGIVGYQNGGQSSWTDGPNDPTALPGTSYTYTVKNIDQCGNISTGSSDTVTTASQSLSHLFSSDPTTHDTAQTSPLTVGMHWQTSTAGDVWGVRFYRENSSDLSSRYNVGLWDNDGTLLASREVPAGNQQEGWIDVRFNSPISVSANHDYVVGYFSQGGESYTSNVFTSTVTNGSLSARADSSGTPNGVYSIGNSMSFPNTRASNAIWYGVDVNFSE